MATEPAAKDTGTSTPAADSVKAMASLLAIPAVASLAFAEPTMGVGAPIPQVTGQTGLEVVGRGGSQFMNDFMAATFVAGAFTLVQALSTPPPTPAQQEAMAHEAQMKAELAKQDALKQENLTEEDARRQQAGLEEERRKAYFSNKGPG
ncbi:MAG: hypothetical protein EPN97_09675 [Alphaproteobacteria bacterium]|nr:MAG: hypothetical protein EPN97_09675 [Alphaproteobacteria bacterium]